MLRARFTEGPLDVDKSQAVGLHKMIRTAEDAERAACLKMRDLGFVDARLTKRGPDGGVDVWSTEAVAQVKAQTVPVGPSVIQAIFGIAQADQKIAVCFSLAGYSALAKDWASQAGVALFEFDLQGECIPVNTIALRLEETGAGVCLVVKGSETEISPDITVRIGTATHRIATKWGLVMWELDGADIRIRAVDYEGRRLFSVNLFNESGQSDDLAWTVEQDSEAVVAYQLDESYNPRGVLFRITQDGVVTKASWPPGSERKRTRSGKVLIELHEADYETEGSQQRNDHVVEWCTLAVEDKALRFVPLLSLKANSTVELPQLIDCDGSSLIVHRLTDGCSLLEFYDFVGGGGKVWSISAMAAVEVKDAANLALISDSAAVGDYLIAVWENFNDEDDVVKYLIGIERRTGIVRWKRAIPVTCITLSIEGTESLALWTYFEDPEYGDDWYELIAPETGECVKFLGNRLGRFTVGHSVILCSDQVDSSRKRLYHRDGALNVIEFDWSVPAGRPFLHGDRIVVDCDDVVSVFNVTRILCDNVPTTDTD